jgi:hypothetical protein
VVAFKNLLMVNADHFLFSTQNEIISVDEYMKQIRIYARQQYAARALARKIFDAQRANV